MICPSPKLSKEAAITGTSHARDVTIVPLGLKRSNVLCMISAIPIVEDPAILSLPTLNIVAVNVARIARPIRMIWPYRIAIIPIAWSVWLSVWSWRTGYPIAGPPGIYGVITGFLFPGAPSRTGSRPRGKKAESAIEADYLERVLSDFSGYIAADELYDGPFCVLSIVDNHAFHRLTYAVLDHDPTCEDIRRFFQRFKHHLDVRGLAVVGITTDGSPLYPEPILQVFGADVDHQVCEFHVLQEITKAILKAVARSRKHLKARKAKRGRGRPSGKKARAVARKNKRLQQKIKDLFDHRHLFVKRTLTDKEKRILRRITRGFPSLRALRSIMDQVYHLFDRRCRTETALEKLGRLRARVRRFRSLRETLSKLFSPNLERALTFLDDRLLPATSNAVERGNRRHRKMQKSIYRVRTQDHIRQRIAVDMYRDLHCDKAKQTIISLHLERGRTRRKVG
jgi:hypothetical protein